jgi:hypothetical protein
MEQDHGERSQITASMSIAQAPSTALAFWRIGPDIHLPRVVGGPPSFFDRVTGRISPSTSAGGLSRLSMS